LVEDNAAMRTLIRSLVESVTPTVHECADGESAVDLYARLRPDAVLMDINLGGMDGIAATRAIREADPDARVIIVTENGDEGYRRAAEVAGASGFVLKQDLRGLPALLASRVGLE
jgi:two-component system response regulator DesR